MTIMYATLDYNDYNILMYATLDYNDYNDYNVCYIGATLLDLISV